MNQRAFCLGLGGTKLSLRLDVETS